MASAPTQIRRIAAMTSFLNEIRQKMEEQQLSHTELAEKAAVSRAYLYRILDGTQTPSMEIADRIAAALGLIITTTPAR